MSWNLIDSGFRTGKFNMDFDVDLARNCKDDEAYLRFYRWKPYCISLGANQSYDDINLKRAEEDCLDVVKRPTGGRAILHAEELTYSVILPMSFGYSPKETYTKISLALVNGLKKYDERLSAVELENLQPNFGDILKTESGALCFASAAKSEVKYKNKKLIGSAQRKMNKIILQHGSILCGGFHSKLPRYLKAKDEKQIAQLNNELKNKTTEIETILNNKTDYEKLINALVEGFSEEWQIEFFNSTKEPEYEH